MNVKILDCTFRDGGYYTNWDFSPSLVNKYLHSMSESGIDAIEIGFRFLPKSKFLGAFAYSTDDLIRSLDTPDVPLGIMINGSDVVDVPVDKVLSSADESPVNRVRLAIHFSKIEQNGTAAKRIKSLGYELGVNMMQAAGKSDEDISKATATIRDWNVVDFLYFADSLGNMSPSDVSRTIKVIRSEWDGPIGFHGHDNKGLALINSVTAAESGAAWVDGTVLGMGRGAGNTRTEYLLTELPGYKPSALFPLVMSEFAELQKEHGWGPSLLYYLSAIYGIHPTYIQEMVSSLQYSSDQILEGIESLRKAGSSSYSVSRLEGALLGEGIEIKGSWSAKSWFDGRDVLLVASGDGTVRHLGALISYVKKHNPFVICLNCNTGFPNNLVDAYASCNKTRLMTEILNYQELGKPVLMPRELITNDHGIKIFNYGIKVEGGKWKSEDMGCVVPQMLVAPYVMAAIKAGGARRVLLAGFDGYGAYDPRQNAMNEVVRLYDGPQLISITPSSYDVDHSSVYAMI